MPQLRGRNKRLFRGWPSCCALPRKMDLASLSGFSICIRMFPTFQLGASIRASSEVVLPPGGWCCQCHRRGTETLSLSNGTAQTHESISTHWNARKRTRNARVQAHNVTVVCNLHSVLKNLHFMYALYFALGFLMRKCIMSAILWAMTKMMGWVPNFLFSQ